MTGGVSFGGTFNGNPLTLAAARTTLDELAIDAGAPLVRANQLGQHLMSDFRKLARKHDVPLAVCGFGAAFAIHFTEVENLIEYRDTLPDDRNKLRHFLYRMLMAGIYTLPDGRFYISTAHTEEDIGETSRAIDRIFADPELKKPSQA